jgi:hypothetical protein
LVPDLTLTLLGEYPAEVIVIIIGLGVGVGLGVCDGVEVGLESVRVVEFGKGSGSEHLTEAVFEQPESALGFASCL